MIPLISAVATTDTNANLWKSALFAGVFTAVAGLLFVFLIGTPIVAAILGLVVGAAPILGVQMAKGSLGSNWRSVIAGAVGFILFIAVIFLGQAAGWAAPVLALLSMLLLWPLIVGIVAADVSLGKAFVGSIIGLVLAVAVFFLVANFLGQNPNAWPAPAGVFAFSVWGGSVGAALSKS